MTTKSQLIEQLRTILTAELDVLLRSAAAARDAATHAENKPENKYDTRGLEASYLAGAQAERAAELQRDLQILANIPLRDFVDGDKISATALVVVEREGSPDACYFVMPVGGGARLDAAGGIVTVVTPQSPIGRALQEGQVEVKSLR